jgi:hypothetical protein
MKIRRPPQPTIRRWDGTRWTDGTEQGIATPAIPPAVALPRHAGRNAGLGQIAMVWWAAAQVIGLLMLWLAFRAAQSAPSSGEPELGDVIKVFAAFLGFGVLWMVSFVPLVVWTYRSASAAAALGLPATLAPVWSIVGWVIPTMHIVLPFLSVLDCLPPGHQKRRLILPWWIGLQLVSYAYIALFLLDFVFGTTPLLVLLAPVAVVTIATTWMGADLAERIDEAHRAILH